MSGPKHVSIGTDDIETITLSYIVAKLLGVTLDDPCTCGHKQLYHGSYGKVTCTECECQSFSPLAQTPVKPTHEAPQAPTA